MNFLDIIIAIPLVWFAWKGFGKGLIIELAGLIALALGIYLSIRFASYTAIKLKETFSISENYLQLTAFIVTFIAVVAFVFIFAKMLEAAVKASSLSLMNKLAGMAFGMLKTALILSSLIYILNRFDTLHSILGSEQRKQSLLFEPVEKIAPALYPYMDLDKWKTQADSISQKVPEVLK